LETGWLDPRPLVDLINDALAAGKSFDRMADRAADRKEFSAAR
jgi:hypothetical protein